MDNQPNTEFKQLRESFAALSTDFKEIAKTFKEAKAEDKLNEMGKMMENCHARIDYLHQRLSRAEDGVWTYQNEHSKNHVPPLKAAAMAKFLKAVGMEGDYEISKPHIVCSAGRQGLIIEAEYKKP